MVSSLVTALMKLNKSFVVHRDVPRNQLYEYSERLSAYIRTSIKENSSVWLAQKSGRTKDGNDQSQNATLAYCFLEHLPRVHLLVQRMAELQRQTGNTTRSEDASRYMESIATSLAKGTKLPPPLSPSLSSSSATAPSFGRKATSSDCPTATSCCRASASVCAGCR